MIHKLHFKFVTFFVVTFFVTQAYCFSSSKLTDDGEPLILTPLLENGKINEALKKSQVKHPEFGKTRSFSGFFTVNKTSNSNLFFWYFPAEEDTANAPVVLWLQGGPGDSSLLGLFTETGPFKFKNETSIEMRNYRWNKNRNVIYIDSPVGTGYSFTNNGTHCKSTTEVGEHLYEALKQFYIMFPSLVNHSLFLAGESYGGKYVPTLAKIVHEYNLKGNLKMNLQGLAISSGMTDPINQSSYADYLFNVGIIDSNAAAEIKLLEKTLREKIKSKQWKSGFDVWVKIIGEYLTKSGSNNYYSYLDPVSPPEKYNPLISSFIQRPKIKTALHVGNKTFNPASDEVYSNLSSDIVQTVAPKLAEMLSHYPVLIYNGQVDVIVNYPATVSYLEKLNFNGSSEYKKALRKIWEVDNEVAGFVKVAGNLTEVMVKNAGHMIAYDQPKWVYDLTEKFMKNQDIA